MLYTPGSLVADFWRLGLEKYISERLEKGLHMKAIYNLLKLFEIRE
jgi:hypothetical protein